MLDNLVDHVFQIASGRSVIKTQTGEKEVALVGITSIDLIKLAHYVQTATPPGLRQYVDGDVFLHSSTIPGMPATISIKMFISYNAPEFLAVSPPKPDVTREQMQAMRLSLQALHTMRSTLFTLNILLEPDEQRTTILSDPNAVIRYYTPPRSSKGRSLTPAPAMPAPPARWRSHQPSTAFRSTDCWLSTEP